MSAASWPRCVDAMDDFADQLVALLPPDGRRDGEIVEALKRQFPGLPSENCYWQRASLAIMRHIRRGQQLAIGDRVDRARLRENGKPEAWAERPR